MIFRVISDLHLLSLCRTTKGIDTVYDFELVLTPSFVVKVNEDISNPRTAL